MSRCVLTMLMCLDMSRCVCISRQCLVMFKQYLHISLWCQWFCQLIPMALLHSFGQNHQNEVQYHLFCHVFRLGTSITWWAMSLSMAHDTDATINTSTGTEKSWIISLYYHLNMPNAKVSLLAPSETCDRKQVIAMYVPKSNLSFKCHI